MPYGARSVFTTFVFIGGPLAGREDLRISSSGNPAQYLSEDGQTAVSAAAGRAVERAARLARPLRSHARVRACYGLSAFRRVNSPEGRSVTYEWFDATGAEGDERPPIPLLELLNRRVRDVNWDSRTGLLTIAFPGTNGGMYCETSYTFYIIDGPEAVMSVNPMPPDSTAENIIKLLRQPETHGSEESGPAGESGPEAQQSPNEGTDGQ